MSKNKKAHPAEDFAKQLYRELVESEKKIQQLQQQNETLQASLDNCLRQNQEMLEMLKSISDYSGITYMRREKIDALITKIENGE